MRKLLFAVIAIVAGCAQLQSVDQAKIHAADDNVLCSESNENAARYDKKTILSIQAELAARNNPDCSIPARMTRSSMAASTDELCVADVLAPIHAPAAAPYARAELQRRGATCDPQRTNVMVQAFIAKQQQEAQQAQAAALQAQADAAQRQAASAAFLNGLLLMQQAQPPRPATINCNSTTIGISTNTNCRQY